MNYSPAIMDRFTRETLPMQASTRYDFLPVKPTPVFRWKGTYAQYQALAKDCAGDTGSLAFQRGFRHAYAFEAPEWAGFNKGTLAQFQASGISEDAVIAFNAALARLDVKGNPASPIPAISGGVWSVPKYLSGHPLCAIKRPRTALPPKNWDIGVSISANIRAEAIAAPFSRIARAAWLYQLQGGVVSITIHFTAGFSEDWEGQSGAIISVKIPLTNVAAFATAVSPQSYRAVSIPIRKGLSGARDDGLPLLRWAKPGMVQITGDREKDAQALHSLGIV